MKYILLFFSLTMILHYTHSRADTQDRVTGITFPFEFEVATSEFNSEKIEQGIVLFKIQCAPEMCSVSQILLDNCKQNTKDQGFSKPGGGIMTTQSSFLEASLSGNELELVWYQATHHSFPAKIIATFDDSSLTKLKAFNAIGFLDTSIGISALLTHDKFLEYIPFHGNQFKKLDCPVFLPGINKYN